MCVKGERRWWDLSLCEPWKADTTMLQVHHIITQMYVNLAKPKLKWKIHRYNFKGFITDPSATAAITFFTPAADKVTGYTCPELIAKHKTADQQEIPPEIFAVEGQKNVFQIHFNSGDGTPNFILDQVFDKKKRDEGTSSTIQIEAGENNLLNTLSYLNMLSPHAPPNYSFCKKQEHQLKFSQ